MLNQANVAEKETEGHGLMAQSQQTAELRSDSESELRIPLLECLHVLKAHEAPKNPSRTFQEGSAVSLCSCHTPATSSRHHHHPV